MLVENTAAAVLIGIDIGCESLVTATTSLASSSIPSLVRNNLSNDATPTGAVKSLSPEMGVFAPPSPFFKIV